MNDRIFLWSIWLTSILLCLFLMLAVTLQRSDIITDLRISGERQNLIERHIEVMRTQILQLEKVNREGLRKLQRGGEWKR
jgi:hypothetical protein